MKFIMIVRFTAAAFLFGSVCIRRIAKEPYKHWTCGRKAKGNPKIKRKTKTTETKKINQKKITNNFDRPKILVYYFERAKHQCVDEKSFVSL